MASRRSTVTIGDVEVGGGRPLCLIAGPCVLEDESLVLRTADAIAAIAEEAGIPVIFKSSYEKDNRSTIDGYRGPGLDAGLSLLAKVRDRTGLRLCSDVHREVDVAAATEILDVVQVPAFLCRQTGLLLEVGRRSRVVNLKKGQFMAPADMEGSVGKVRAGGCEQILLTERGSCFGYNQLVADLTAIPIMQGLGCPVVFDATHIVRRYGIPSRDPAGGRPELVPTLARAGVAAGCDVLFVETHPNPSEARCDAASMLPLSDLPALLAQVVAIAACVREHGA